AVPATEMSQEALQEMRRRYVMKAADLTPRVYYRLTDNWLELTVRFVVRDHGIRDVKDAMSRDIIEALDTAGIGVASATFEIVGVPAIRIQEDLLRGVDRPAGIAPESTRARQDGQS
ncbi:MAG: hypothetical protein U0790_29455, partial [Isosphaeraceae bacterium]